MTRSKKDRGGAMEALVKASPENPSPSNDTLYKTPANRRLSQTAHFPEHAKRLGLLQMDF